MLPPVASCSYENRMRALMDGLVCWSSAMLDTQHVVSRDCWLTESPIELLCSPTPLSRFSTWFSSGSARAESHSRVLEASRTNCCWLFLPLHIWHVWEVSRGLVGPWAEMHVTRSTPSSFEKVSEKERGWSGACRMKALDMVTSSDKHWD